MIFKTKLMEKLEEEILENVTIIILEDEDDIITEASKFKPKKPGVEILIRCSQEHKASHGAAFKITSGKTNKSAEIEVKRGHGKNAKYGYFPKHNSDKNLTPAEKTYAKKFAEKNAEIIDAIWYTKKESKEYRDYMEKLKEENPDCKVTGDLGGPKKKKE